LSTGTVQHGRGGVEFEDLEVGDGPVVGRGANVEVSYTLALNRGEIVQSEERYRFRLGERRVAAGLEYGVEGMRVGGARRIQVGPHLAYGDRSIPGAIPANAVLEFRVRLLGAELPKEGVSSRRRG
jgi:FKBP-type peptidyl-prolyl cis-trans isomerase